MFQRGNVPTASFHRQRIPNYPDLQVFGVFTSRDGLMPGDHRPLPPPERRAAIISVRELERRGPAGARPAPAGIE